MIKSIFTTLACTSLLAACASLPEPAPDNQALADDVARATALIGDGWPASASQRATTDGELYLSNLNSQIAAIDGNPGLASRTGFHVTLAGLLYQRFQIEGRLADAERALALLESAKNAPDYGLRHRLVHARVLMGFHAFDEVEAQIAAARADNAAPADTDALQAALDEARRLQPAGHEGTFELPEGSGYVQMVRAASALVDQGRLTDASQLLRRAQASYHNTNPLPLAWIYVQQGIAFLRYGEIESARRFFAAAHERLPDYFLAAEHLAETEALLGNHERAAVLYRRVTAQNDQPAFWHALADVERALGNEEAAADAAERAATGYAQLLAQHPLMYADHAVGYYLEVGNPAEAVRLAQLNFRHRQDLSAHLALAEALAGAGDEAQACVLVQTIREAGLAPPEITVAGETLAACP